MDLLLLEQRKTRERHRAELQTQRDLFEQQLRQVGMTRTRPPEELQREQFPQKLQHDDMDQNHLAGADRDLQQLERDVVRERLLKKRLQVALQQQEAGRPRPVRADHHSRTTDDRELHQTRTTDDRDTATGLGLLQHDQNALPIVQSGGRYGRTPARQHATSDINDKSNRLGTRRDGRTSPETVDLPHSTRGVTGTQPLPHGHHADDSSGGDRSGKSHVQQNKSSVMKDLMSMLDSSSDDDGSAEEYHAAAVAVINTALKNKNESDTVAVGVTTSNNNDTPSERASANTSRTAAVSRVDVERSTNHANNIRTAVVRANEDNSDMTMELRREILSLRREYQEELEQELDKRMRKVCRVCPVVFCARVCAKYAGG